eukprot:scaffold1954_cov268-Pinguiococcus_pyrenoidosus.AAC.126
MLRSSAAIAVCAIGDPDCAPASRALKARRASVEAVPTTAPATAGADWTAVTHQLGCGRAHNGRQRRCLTMAELATQPSALPLSSGTTTYGTASNQGSLPHRPRSPFVVLFLPFNAF